MDFDAIIREHADYRVKLVLYLNDSCSIDEKRLSNSGYCTLGHWIKQSGRQFSSCSEFSDLIGTHKRFHAIVKEILELIRLGKRYEAREALKENGLLSHVTTDLNQKLLLLKRRFAKGA